MAAEPTIGNARRYCLLQYRCAIRDATDMESVWDAKRRTLPGTPIPAEFPARVQLIGAGYLALEEVAGADDSELTSCGLTQTQAAAVMAAIG